MNQQDSPYFYTWSQQETPLRYELEDAHGVNLYLANGQRLIDLSSTSFHCSFGYQHAGLNEALASQLRRPCIANPKADFSLKGSATKNLLEFLRVPDGGKIFYTVSGAEAVENALKMARQVTSKSYILARRRSYHGATLGALSVTGDWRTEAHLNFSEHTLRIPEPSEPDALERTRKIIETIGPEKIAGFCLETITAMNGVIIPSAEWWQGIQALCNEFNLLLILDEVSCGFYRTGKPFAFHHYDIAPDLVCTAKTISGGYVPFGAMWANATLSEYYHQNVLSLGLTNYGHPLGLAAMQEVLHLLQEETFMHHYRARMQEFHAHLDRLAQKPEVLGVRKIGMLAGIEVDKKSALSWRNAVAQGLHLACKDNLIVLAPAYVITKDELEEGFARVEKFIEAEVVAG